ERRRSERAQRRRPRCDSERGNVHLHGKQRALRVHAASDGAGHLTSAGEGPGLGPLAQPQSIATIVGKAGEKTLACSTGARKPCALNRYVPLGSEASQAPKPTPLTDPGATTGKLSGTGSLCQVAPESEENST